MDEQNESTQITSDNAITNNSTEPTAVSNGTNGVNVTDETNGDAGNGNAGTNANVPNEDTTNANTGAGYNESNPDDKWTYEKNYIQGLPVKNIDYIRNVLESSEDRNIDFIFNNWPYNTPHDSNILLQSDNGPSVISIDEHTYVDTDENDINTINDAIRVVHDVQNRVRSKMRDYIRYFKQYPSWVSNNAYSTIYKSDKISMMLSDMATIMDTLDPNGLYHNRRATTQEQGTVNDYSSDDGAVIADSSSSDFDDDYVASSLDMYSAIINESNSAFERYVSHDGNQSDTGRRSQPHPIPANVHAPRLRKLYPVLNEWVQSVNNLVNVVMPILDRSCMTERWSFRIDEHWYDVLVPKGSTIYDRTGCEWLPNIDSLTTVEWRYVNWSQVADIRMDRPLGTDEITAFK